MEKASKRDLFLLAIGILTALLPTAILFSAVTYLFVATLVAGIITIIISLWPPSRSRRLAGGGLCAAAIVGSFSLIAYESSSGPPIKLVIPNDYVGTIRIQVDENHGIPPRREGGYWVYRLGDDGALLTSDEGPFHRWHTMRAEFRDGRVIQGYVNDTVEHHEFQIVEGGMNVVFGPAYVWTIQRTDTNGAARQLPTYREFKNDQ